jgi:hypothetical protein
MRWILEFGVSSLYFHLEFPLNNESSFHGKEASLQVNSCQLFFLSEKIFDVIVVNNGLVKRECACFS